DPGVAPRRILVRHPDHEALDLAEDRATTSACPQGPFPRHELAMPARSVSGVAIEAISRNVHRPTRMAQTASRRRSASVSRLVAYRVAGGAAGSRRPGRRRLRGRGAQANW